MVEAVRLLEGHCVEVMREMEPDSFDAVVTDPPYAEIGRPYGRLTEIEWDALMRDVVTEVRRVLKPTGSAVFILQANSEHVGRMRPWLWEFMAWTAREWNQVQDAWWWNPTAPPTVHCHEANGLMRPSLKACVWLGASDCYRNQSAVLWTESAANAAVDRSDRALRIHPSGLTIRPGRAAASADRRGGVTPFNVLPAPNTNSVTSAGAHGHGAGTPQTVCRWWARYITPPGGRILDPFCGSGSTLIAALREGFSCVGIEQDPAYIEIARQRIQGDAPLFNRVSA